MSEPMFQDRVKHKFSAEVVTGTVIAKYPIEEIIQRAKALGVLSKTKLIISDNHSTPQKQLLDVRSDDDRIYWATPAENWEVVREYDQNKEE